MNLSSVGGIVGSLLLLSPRPTCPPKEGVTQDDHYRQRAIRQSHNGVLGKDFIRYFLQGLFPVEDDDAPFIRAGIPAVDLISLEYSPFNAY
jgi:hypothetical protein